MKRRAVCARKRENLAYVTGSFFVLARPEVEVFMDKKMKKKRFSSI